MKRDLVQVLADRFPGISWEVHRHEAGFPAKDHYFLVKARIKDRTAVMPVSFDYDEETVTEHVRQKIVARLDVP